MRKPKEHGRAETRCGCEYCAAAKRVQLRTKLGAVERAKLMGRILGAAHHNEPLPIEALSIRDPDRPKPEPVIEPEPEPEPRKGGRLHLTRLGWVWTCKDCDDFRGPYVFEDEAEAARDTHEGRVHVQ